MIIIAVLLDTSFLISYFDSRDRNHARAVTLSEELESRKFGGLFLSDYIFDETITLLKKCVGNKTATAMCDKLLAATELLHIDNMLFKEAWALSKKYDVLSFTDCSSISLLNHHGIDFIATFDSGFKGIVRVLD